MADEIAEQLTMLREQMRSGFPDAWDHQTFDALLKQLNELPAADDRRLEAIDIATRYAKAADLAVVAKDHQDYRRDHRRLGISWKILQSLGIIRDGNLAESVVAILGKPSKRWRIGDTEVWRWYYAAPAMHVNPGLDITFKDGVVVGIKGVTS